MAVRPAWKGYLKLSLVTCAVEMTNATSSSEKVSFRTLNRATGNPVKLSSLPERDNRPPAPALDGDRGAILSWLDQAQAKAGS